MAETHPTAVIHWTGSTLDPAYSRISELTKEGGRGAIPASSLPSFGGDAACWNPEDLLAAALSQCHMLTFLALAAKVRLDILAYEGGAEAVLETADRISRVGVIALRPTIRVAPGTDAAKVEELFQKAHKYCVIANSFNGTVLMEPRVVGA
jgi:organic hydroperoxide reductase OsmC/OhrA